MIDNVDVPGNAKINLSKLVVSSFVIYTCMIYFVRATKLAILLKPIIVGLIIIFSTYLIFCLKKFRKSTEMLLIFLFYICVSVSSLRVFRFDHFTQFTIGILLILISTTMKKENIVYGIKLFIVFGFIYALGSILQKHYPDFFYHRVITLYNEGFQKDLLKALRNNKAYAGFTPQVAFTAGYISTSIGLILGSWMIRPPKKRLLMLGVLGLLFYGLLLTGKRAHFLFTVISLALVYITINSHSIKKLLKAVSKQVVLIISGATLLPIYLNKTGGSQAIKRTLKVFQDILSGSDVTSGRTKLYSAAWRLFLENPIFGIGWWEFRMVHSTGILSTDMSITSDVHNVFLQVLTETGIIGFLLFSIMTLYSLFSTYKKIKLTIKFKHKKNHFSLTLLTLSLYIQLFFLLYCITGNPLYDTSFLLTYFFGLAMNIMVTMSDVKI